MIFVYMSPLIILTCALAFVGVLFAVGWALEIIIKFIVSLFRGATHLLENEKR